MKKGRLNIGECALYYEIHGTGLNLILIEGLGVATWIWEKQIPRLKNHFQTIVYDNRGVGRSDKPLTEYTIEGFVDDLVQLMEKLHVDKAHILGLSMGGFIAQNMALRYPEKVDNLVLVATSCGGPQSIPMSEQSFKCLLNVDSDTEALRQRLLLAYTPAYLTPDNFEHLKSIRQENPQPIESFKAQAQAGLGFDSYAWLPDISAKTLILAAEDDPLVPVQNANILANRIKHSTLIKYKIFRHQFLVENATIVNKDIISFLLNS